jgi:hypothetical protein
MKTIGHLIVGLAGLVAAGFAQAQGTAFTYQGQLQSDGSPANGTYDLEFSLYSAAVGGALLGGPTNIDGVSVAHGLFTVLLDFGGSVWSGQTNWLEIALETNGLNEFTTLAPRQQLTPAPVAIFAGTAGTVSGILAPAGLSGTYPGPVIFNNISNRFTGDGSGLSNLTLPSTFTNFTVYGSAAGTNWDYFGPQGAIFTNVNGSYVLIQGGSITLSGDFNVGGVISGNLAGATNLNASALSSGTIPLSVENPLVLTNPPNGTIGSVLVNTGTGAQWSTGLPGYDVSSVAVYSTNVVPTGLIHKLVYVSGTRTNAQFQVLRGLWSYNPTDNAGLGMIHPILMANSCYEGIPLYFGFVLDGAQFYFGVQSKNTTPVLNINGLDYTNIPPLADQNGGDTIYYRVNFQSSGRRNIIIKILTADFSNEGFAGVWVNPSCGWIDTLPKRYKLWVVGSSHTETPDPGAAISGWPPYLNDVDYGADLMKLFANLDDRPEGSGGTGIANPGALPCRSRYQGRLGDAFASQPDMIGIEALANDNAYSSNAFATNFVALIQDITNNLPGTPIVIWTSPEAQQGSAAGIGNYTVLTNLVAAMGLTNFIDLCADPLFPAGGNLAYQQAGGGPHLSPLGNWIYAEGIASQLGAFFPQLVPSGYTASYTPVTIPSNLSATAGSNLVYLTWSAPLSGADSYVIGRNTVSGAETNYAVTTGTNFTDPAVTNGTSYYYNVSAVVNGVTNSPSYEVWAQPSAYESGPTNVSMQMVRWLDPTYGTYADLAGTTPATNNQPVLLWKDKSTNHYDMSGNVSVGTGLFLANAFNGQPLVGNSNLYQLSVFTNMTAEPGYSNVTMVVGFQSFNGPLYGCLFDWNDIAGGSGPVSMSASINSGMWQQRYGPAYAIIAKTNYNMSWYMINYGADGNTIYCWSNGVPVGANQSLATTNQTTGLTLGAVNQGSSGNQFAYAGLIEYVGYPTTNGANSDLVILSNWWASRGIHN